MSILRKSAKGQECMIRLPGVCNHNPETTVLAHMNGAGMGIKSHDLHAAFACSACHDAVDGRSNETELRKFMLSYSLLMGVIKTQKFWIEKGYIDIKQPEKQPVSNFEDGIEI